MSDYISSGKQVPSEAHWQCGADAKVHLQASEPSGGHQWLELTLTGGHFDAGLALLDPFSFSRDNFFFLAISHQTRQEKIIWPCHR